MQRPSDHHTSEDTLTLCECLVNIQTSQSTNLPIRESKIWVLEPLMTHITIHDLKDKTIVTLLAFSTARAPIYNHLKEHGTKIVAVDPDVDSVSSHFPSVTHWIEHDPTDVDGLEEKLRDSEIPVDAIMAFDEFAVYQSTVLAERFGLAPTPLSSSMLSTIHTKSTFRKWCELNDLAVPRSVAIHHRNDDSVKLARRRGLEFPIVAKPSPGAGSHLVQRVDNATELEEAVEKIWREVR